MKILALDTSSQAASCALLFEDTLLSEYFLNGGVTHSQTLLPLVEQMLAMSDVSLKDIDVIAVSKGPGSFTGLRIGISSVKGMALGLGLPVVGVSTLKGLAYNVLHHKGYIAPCMDARRGNLYTALFYSDGTTLTRVLSDQNISITQLGDKLLAKLPTKEPVLLVGDGSQITYQALKDIVPVSISSPTLLHQRAASVALAAKEMIIKEGTISADALEPVYLRISQAERERKEREQNSNNK